MTPQPLIRPSELVCGGCGGRVWLLLSMFGPICKGCYAAGKGRDA